MDYAGGFSTVPQPSQHPQQPWIMVLNGALWLKML
jgi:hypothetical protein